DTFAKHFAAAEKATETDAQGLITEDTIIPTDARWDGTALPSIAALTNGFATLKKAKASGLSGLPAEAYLGSPLAAALKYWPAIVKELLRDRTAIHWRGGEAIPIPKPSKAPDACTGYRPIALLETDSKAVQKALRPAVVKALQTVQVPDQYGGRPGCTLGLPIACVKAHFDGLKREGKSGAAIFFDCTTAYYAVIKDMLTLTDDQRGDTQLLQHRARLLFVDTDQQEAFIKHMQQGELASALGATPELRALIRQHLKDTWFVCRQGTGQVYRSECGTIPGAPLADALFSLVFAGILREVKVQLQANGWEPKFCSRQGGAGSTPTWADDTCALVSTADAADVVPAIQTTTATMVRCMARAGLSANFGPGKTEAMVAYHGRGSRAPRLATLCREDPVITLPHSSMTGHIRVVPEYLYLGILLRADGQELPGLKHRRSQMQAIFQPLRAKLLWNTSLSKSEKLELLRGRVLSRFLYGAGHWLLRTEQEQQAFREAISGVYRGSFRAILGVSSCRFSCAETAAALELPLPDEWLATERAKLLVRLCTHRLSGVVWELQHEASWWNSACEHLAKMQLLASSTAGPDEMQDMLAGKDVQVRNACRLYLKRACKRRRLPPEYIKERAKAAPIQVLALKCDRLPFACEVCGSAFRSKRLLSIHRANSHGLLAEHRLVSFGTACQVCGMEFWSESRLSGHLKHAHTCRKVYRESDIHSEAAPAPLNQGEHAWIPARAFHGPRPWWATLRPKG
ncbi:unnamed protein product, partial [Symbiodinium sp. CCMP2456]